MSDRSPQIKARSRRPAPKDRLTKTHEYHLVYTKGKRAKGHILWAYCLCQKTGKKRLGISIGRKAIKKATGRNRLKRVVRAWFEANKADFKDVGCDIVITAKKDPGKTRQALARIREELNMLFADVGLYKG